MAPPVLMNMASGSIRLPPEMVNNCCRNSVLAQILGSDHGS